MRKVLHAPVDIAGQMGAFVRELRKRGWQANGYNWYRNYFQYNGPILQTDYYEVGKEIEPILRMSDIVHYHNGSTFLKDYGDLELIRKLGKKAIMHHWGNDVRDVARANEQQKYKLPPSYHDSAEIHANLRKVSSYVSHAIIQDFELYRYISPYYEHIHFLPLIVDVGSLPYAYPNPRRKKPLVVHAPTNTAFKGTEYLESALRRLSDRCDFFYKRIEHMKHSDAMRWYLRADVVIDQILCGTYGLLSVETMAMGKPVVAYIREDIRSAFPDDLPIVSADPDQLEERLLPLLRSPELRHRIGRQGRSFTSGFHDVDVVMPQLMDIYRSLT